MIQRKRDGGGTVVHVASTRAKAFDWVRHNFHPELEPPSEKNTIFLIPIFVDREAPGRLEVSARRMPDGGLRFVDTATGKPIDR